MGGPLVAFALVAEEYERSGDPVLGLKPLFEPVLAKYSDSAFDPDAFARDFTSDYGLAMTPFVARALAERLVQIGLLLPDKSTGSGYHVVSISTGSARDFKETHIDETVATFVKWATTEARRLNRTISAPVLEEAFLSRLARPGFASIFLEETEVARTERLKGLLGKVALVEDSKNEELLDYLSARFILTACDSAPEVFDAISSISYGSLIADAVAGLSLPGQSSMPDPALRVVLDGPLLLDVLDLNTEEHRDYAQGFLELLKKAGIRLATFDHIVDEMLRSIRATLAAFSNKNAYGPLAERIRRKPNHRLYATAVADALEERIRALDVVIMPGAIYEENRFKKYFSDDALDRVRNSIGDVHHQIERRMRDAKSVALVARLKAENKKPSSVLKAGTIFVTRNSALNTKVNRALSVGHGEAMPRFTIATDGQLAGILWFVLGSDGLEMSRKRLIANCATAILPKKEVIQRISAVLDGMDSALSDEFSAMMSDERASLCPMRMTAGLPEVIDENLVREMLATMRDELVAPLKEEAIRKEEAVNEVIGVMAEDLRKARDTAVLLQGVAAQEAARVEEKDKIFGFQLAQIEHELAVAKANESTAQTALSELKKQADRSYQDVVMQVDGKATELYKRLRIIIYTGFALVTLASFVLSESLILRIVTAAVSLACIPVFSDWFERGLSTFSRWYFRGERELLSKLGNQED